MVFLPTSLAFVAATAAYVFDQSIANNRLYLFVVIVVVIWTATFLNMGGLRESGRIGAVGVLLATIVPSVVLIAVGLLFLVTLVIMVAMPPSQLNVVSGFMETFEILFDRSSLGWLVPVLAGLITIGWIGRVTNIFIGPATGLLAAARYGHLPEKLTVENRRSAPRNMLVAQAIIATVASVPFALLSDPQAAFAVLATTAVSIYLVMYVMMYISAIRLRYTRRDVPRPFRIPGGNAAMWAVAGLGIVSASFALVLGLAPPAGIFEGIRWLYPTMILGGVVVAVALGLVVDRGGEAPTEVRPHVVADVGEAGESFLDDTADLDTPDLDVPTESGAD